MKLQRIVLLLLSCGFFSLSLNAQTHQCGTEHSAEFMARLTKNVKYANENASVRKVVDKRYVPLKFHLIADSQGNGRIPDRLVYTQICILNTQYDSMGFVFYVDDGFNYYDNTAVYDHQGGAQSTMAGLRNQNSQSINVFITNATFDENVAGYYTGNFDYLVVRKSNFAEANNGTFGHELGHLFSLAHPHVGWEDTPYDPLIHGETVTITTVGSSQSAPTAVEIMNELNCTTAADRICDTPPDYGFTQNAGNAFTCHNPWEGTVKDRNGVLIDNSIPNTVMGYNSCDVVTFTHGQANAMRADFDSRVVSNLSYEPDTTEITEAITTIEPTAFSTTEFYNEVYFSWTAVEGAHSYVLTMSGSGNFEYETEQTEITVYDLEPGASYSWTVYPVNEIGSCQDLPAGVLFFTSSDEVSSINEIDIVSKFSVQPNPVVDQNFTISFQAVSNLDATLSLYDVSGKAIIRNQKTQINQGNNVIPIQLNNAATGLYNLIINTSEGIISEKLIIK